MEDKIKLKNINLTGYKSISAEGQDIPVGDLTVLLGANGSGKSNLVSFFKMLNHMMTGALQTYIGEDGSAESLLHYGSKKTTRIKAKIEFANNTEKNAYEFILSHAAGDTLIFAKEILNWNKVLIKFNSGLKESGLGSNNPSTVLNNNPISNEANKIIYNLLKGCQVFQFHDTSKTAQIRKKGYIEDYEFLRSDAGNLAAFLYTLKNTKNGEKYYNRIIRYIRQVMPQFGDFKLIPSALNENYIMLNWTEKDSDYLFGPHQISDGSLRFMALSTLLLQPPESLPSVIILDEPELGLHPTAISMLAGMAKAASQNSQIILATQSPRLVDEFEPENIVVVERDTENKCSKFKKLDETKLSEWLERYSMSELWEKNVIGGQP